MTETSQDHPRDTVDDSITIDDPPEDLTTDTQGYVVEDNERITDGFDCPIKKTNISGITYLNDHGFHINDDGVIVNDDGTEVWLTIQDERKDVFVPYIHNGDEVALLRNETLSKNALATLLRKSDLFNI